MLTAANLTLIIFQINQESRHNQLHISHMASQKDLSCINEYNTWLKYSFKFSNTE